MKCAYLINSHTRKNLALPHVVLGQKSNQKKGRSTRSKEKKRQGRQLEAEEWRLPGLHNIFAQGNRSYIEAMVIPVVKFEWRDTKWYVYILLKLFRKLWRQWIRGIDFYSEISSRKVVSCFWNTFFSKMIPNFWWPAIWKSTSKLHSTLRSSTCPLTGFFWLLSHVIYLKLTRVL